MDKQILKENCLICGGLITVKGITNIPIEHTINKPICKKHIEEIINHILKNKNKVVK